MAESMTTSGADEVLSSLPDGFSLVPEDGELYLCLTDSGGVQVEVITEDGDVAVELTLDEARELHLRLTALLLQAGQ